MPSSVTEAMIRSLFHEEMRTLHDRIDKLESMVVELAPPLALIVGGASRVFGSRLAESLGVTPIPVVEKNFSNGNMQRTLNQSVRRKRVIVVQSGERAFVQDPEEATNLVSRDFLELLLLVRAARDSAQEVIAVCPYWFYSRSDKKDKPRITLASRMCMDLLAAAGANRLVTLDLHSMQQVGFGPPHVDQLFGMNLLVEHFLGLDLDPYSLVVAAPDMSAAKACNLFAKKMRAGYERMGRPTPDFIPVSVVEKGREDDSENPTVYGIIGEEYVRGGKTCIMLDDEGLTLGTMTKGAARLDRAGAAAVYAATIHGIFSVKAIEKLDASNIVSYVCTDTIDQPNGPPSPEIKQVSVVPLVTEAIRRIHGSGSISQLCE